MPSQRKKPLSSNAIKLIAIAAMTVDHIAWAVFPGIRRNFSPLLMHLIGRITCPIMCYCIAEGVSLHAEHPQVYRASLCFRADLAFLLHIFLARFHRLALLYPVLLRRRAQPDERYVVACVGSCDAARRGKQKDHVRRGAGSAHSAHLPCELPERLELHCLALRYGVRHKPRRSQKQSFWLLFMLRSMRSYISLPSTVCTAFADGRCALAAGFAAL